MNQIKSEEIFCLKDNHNQPIIGVLLYKNLLIEDRFICKQCLFLSPQIVNWISITEAKQKITEIINNLNAKQKYTTLLMLKHIKQFSEKTMNLKSLMIQQFNDVLTFAQEWIQQLQSVQIRSNSINFLEDLKLLIEPDKQNQIEEINKYNLLKINKKLSQISLDVQKYHEEFLQFEQKYTPISDQNKTDQKLVQIELAFSIHQVEWSYALAFNYLSNILVTGFRDEITIWQFKNGVLKYQQNLKGHMDTILCLVFSQKHNWFVSGSCDQTIRCWKEYDNGEWKSSNINIEMLFLVQLLIIRKINQYQVVGIKLLQFGKQILQQMKQNMIIHYKNIMMKYFLLFQINQILHQFHVVEIRKLFYVQRIDVKMVFLKLYKYK